MRVVRVYRVISRSIPLIALFYLNYIPFIDEFSLVLEPRVARNRVFATDLVTVQRFGKKPGFFDGGWVYKPNFALILAAGPLNRSSSARLKTSLGELSANTTIQSGEMLQLAAKYWKIICLENR